MVKKIIAAIFMILSCLSCAKKGSGGSASASLAPNALAIQIGPQAVCGKSGYFNEPCVSVTICTPGTSTCQTISDILVDTGSYGLRIFNQVISVPLTQVNSGSGNPVGECAMFGSANLWGTVKLADVKLGGEPAVTVPIQVVNAGFGTVPASCPSPGAAPSDEGFNGILGVGLFVQDCGPGCTTVTANNMYYSCAGAVCTDSTLSLANQVANPVSFLPVDNNGVLLQMPSISSSGVPTSSGTLIFGIGTQANNGASGVTTYGADGFGNFITVLAGIPLAQQSQSFIDSGSNGLYFPSGTLTGCGGGLAGFWCPASTTVFTAVNKGQSGTPAVSVVFTVANASTLLNSGNQAFNNIAGDNSGGGFDWGLPFFFGRNVFVGIEGKSTPLGTGPFWAY